jgi:hypothetical protein
MRQGCEQRARRATRVAAGTAPFPPARPEPEAAAQERIRRRRAQELADLDRDGRHADRSVSARSTTAGLPTLECPTSPDRACATRRCECCGVGDTPTKTREGQLEFLADLARASQLTHGSLVVLTFGGLAGQAQADRVLGIDPCRDRRRGCGVIKATLDGAGVAAFASLGISRAARSARCFFSQCPCPVSMVVSAIGVVSQGIALRRANTFGARVQQQHVTAGMWSRAS